MRLSGPDEIVHRATCGPRATVWPPGVSDATLALSAASGRPEIKNACVHTRARTGRSDSGARPNEDGPFLARGAFADGRLPWKQSRSITVLLSIRCSNSESAGQDEDGKRSEKT